MLNDWYDAKDIFLLSVLGQSQIASGCKREKTHPNHLI